MNYPGRLWENGKVVTANNDITQCQGWQKTSVINPRSSLAARMIHQLLVTAFVIRLFGEALLRMIRGHSDPLSESTTFVIHLHGEIGEQKLRMGILTRKRN